MNTLIEQCIKCIKTKSALEGKTLGYLCQDILFPQYKRAIVINKNERSYYIITQEGSEMKELLIVINIIAELFNILEFLHKEHLIYPKNINENNLQLYYSSTKKMENTQFNYKYNCGENIFLETINDNYIIKDKDIKLSASIREDSLYESIDFWLNSCIFPTQSFYDYIDRGFITEDKYITNRSLSISRKSLIIAILVAILTPIVTLWIGNTWGITKLDEEQFKSLKEIIAIHDTITTRDSLKIP